ncbi:MAG: SRPBCC family protein, partial [Eubacteriales bacterium]
MKRLMLAFVLLLPIFAYSAEEKMAVVGCETPKYDVTDEAIINASPDVVYKAMVDEYNGKTSWWNPYLSSKLREEDYSGKGGTLCDVTVPGIMTVKFTTKTVEVKENEMIRMHYIDGAFRGEGLWKLEALNGKTKISFRWRVCPVWWSLRIFGPVLPVEKNHSKVMQG